MIYKKARPLKKIFKTQEAKGKAGIGRTQKKGADYVYDPTGLTDPFKSFIAEQEEVTEKKKRKPRTYLETLDLSQLELIAIIVGSQGSWAMVRDSKGLGHVIEKGTAIGTNGGVVHSITGEEVMIREEYKDFRGNIRFKDIAKQLPSLK
ncbi:MAG: pilus assembly protein PilP [Deltaproteobacteria bacterium]|nr:pilus assembly protein PilP [Deltaproteobacteria bacterium]